MCQLQLAEKQQTSPRSFRSKSLVHGVTPSAAMTPSERLPPDSPPPSLVSSLLTDLTRHDMLQAQRKSSQAVTSSHWYSGGMSASPTLHVAIRCAWGRRLRARDCPCLRVSRVFSAQVSQELRPSDVVEAGNLLHQGPKGCHGDVLGDIMALTRSGPICVQTRAHGKTSRDPDNSTLSIP